MTERNDERELEDIRAVFATEAEENLRVLEEGLLEMERQPADSELLDRVFRAAHTVKGGAFLVELEGMGRFAHALEDILEGLRGRDGAGLDEKVVSLLLDGVDALRSMVESVRCGEVPAVAEFDGLRRDLSRWNPSVSDEGLEDPDGAGRKAAGSSHSASTPGRDGLERRPRRELRVATRKLDRLLEAVGEMGVHRRALRTRLLAEKEGRDPELLEALDQGDRILDEVRDAVMDMRLVPLATLFRRFARSVRDMANATGKDVSPRIEDAEVEVDTAIVDQLVEPLTHLVRNAVDHGIETPREREKAGKPRTGTVALRARRRGEMVEVEVADDGAGISRPQLEEGARECGISDAEEMGDTELWNLLFRPGFSTADEVGEYSGRGVGMDAVRRVVEGMRGSVGLQSREGSGTTAAIRVPLTLTIITGLEVGVADATYILPLESVMECVVLPEGVSGAEFDMMRLDGQVLPTVPLARLLGWTGRESTARGPTSVTRRPTVVVVRHGGRAAGLVVERLDSEIETVMRPLEGALEGIRGIGGSTVLEDGSVGLVVDVPGLLRTLDSRTSASADAGAAWRDGGEDGSDQLRPVTTRG